MINWPFDRAPKKNAFVTVSTDFGTMIVNRLDYNTSPNGETYGVGIQLLESSSFDSAEINNLLQILTIQRELRGDGVVMIDGGANIGVHSLAAGRLMQGWGSVLSFEAQERVFYALAGNIAINNLFNVTVRWNALAEESSIINIPVPNYLEHASFGSLEMQYTDKSENIGQQIDMDTFAPVQAISIDSLDLPRVDFLKLDVEGMEEQVLRGAKNTIVLRRPVLQIEQIKSNRPELRKIVDDLGYVIYECGINIIGIHKDDQLRSRIK